MIAIRWTRKDRLRAKQLLKDLAEKVNGWQGIADALGMVADGSRGTVQQWHKRGRVSLAYAAAVRDLAKTHGIECSLAELNPQAKLVETAQ